MNDIEYLGLKVRDCALMANSLTLSAHGEAIEALNKASNLLVEAQIEITAATEANNERTER